MPVVIRANDNDVDLFNRTIRAVKVAILQQSQRRSRDVELNKLRSEEDKLNFCSRVLWSDLRVEAERAMDLLASFQVGSGTW